VAVGFVYQRGKKRLLAVIIAVKCARGDARLLDDLAKRGGRIALFQKFRRRRGVSCLP